MYIAITREMTEYITVRSWECSDWNENRDGKAQWEICDMLECLFIYRGLFDFSMRDAPAMRNFP